MPLTAARIVVVGTPPGHGRVLGLSLLTHAVAVAVVVALPSMAPSPAPRPEAGVPVVAVEIVSPSEMTPGRASDADSRDTPAARPAEAQPVAADNVPKMPIKTAAAASDSESGFPLPPRKPAPPSVPPVILADAAAIAATITSSGVPQLSPTTPKSAPDAMAGDVAHATAGAIAAAPHPGNPPPRYPYGARRNGIEGRVVLLVEVPPDGIGGTVVVKASSGHAILDEAAVAAVRRWRFRPASRDGQPVASLIELPIRFRLRDRGANGIALGTDVGG